MSDYSEQGAVPVEDAATDHPPTVDEVAERQEREHPQQAATRQGGYAPDPLPRSSAEESGAPVEKDPGEQATG